LMSHANGPELFLPALTKVAMADANAKILECYRSLRGHADPAAALTFGLTEEQYEIARNLSHADIRAVANAGLPLWKSRFDLKLVDGKLELDRDHVITSLLMNI